MIVYCILNCRFLATILNYRSLKLKLIGGPQYKGEVLHGLQFNEKVWQKNIVID